MNNVGRIAMVPIAAALVSCGGTDAQMEPRFVAVHNAMTAMGLAQTGAISEGSLPEGAEATVTADIGAGDCHTFVALGTSQVRDLDVRIVDEAGTELGRDTTHDRQAAAQVCPDASGTYQVIVRMAAGQGGYTLSSWSGAVRGGGAVAVRGGSGGGGCAEPIALEVGRPVQGTTVGASSTLQGSCASGNAPERVYRLTVAERAQMTAVLESGFDGALYIQSTCGQAQSELACNDDAPDTSRSEVSATLEPGEYFVIVDGYGDGAGTYDLLVSLAPLQSLAAICGDAPALPLGQPVSGTTQGLPNYFQATCAGGARSSERVYRLDVAQRSRLRLAQESDHDGAIYVRRACEDATSEIACNDDYRDQRHALLTALLDPGRYFVFADGYSSGSAGAYQLTADLAPDTGGGATADACAASGTLAVGGPVDVDTFQARDDYAGSCGGQGAPDVVYEVNVRGRSRLRARVNESQFVGAMYLQRTCGDTTTELACTAIPQEGQADLDTVVQPGSYHLVIDGQSADAFGVANIEVQLDDIAALERACRNAPQVRSGRMVSGDTTGGQDRFQASCAAGAASNDLVYRLRLTRRSIVRATLASTHDGALYLRRDCIDRTTEIACNDDNNDNQHSFIETTLDAGTYYLFVDGFRTGNNGAFTLDVQTSAP